MVLAKTGLYNISGTTETTECQLQQGAGNGNVLDVMDVTLTSAGTDALSLMAATKVTAAGGERLALHCICAGCTGNMRSFFSHLAAIQVGTLSVP